AVVYGFGTLTWPYSGTFFSEPLASLCALAAFFVLLRNDLHIGARSPSARRMVLAGALLGIATAAHISAILFAPFLFIYALYPYWHSKGKRPVLSSALCFFASLGAALALLGYYNYFRFGSLLETGRTVDPSAVLRFSYGMFASPIEGIYGLLFSSNKGLLLFSPVVVVAAFAWPRLHRLHPFLSSVLVAAIAFRIVFIASRSDWHGGFSLGPRYLLMLLPYLCLPLVLLVKDILQRGHKGRYTLFAGTWLLICQQYYFSLGESFSHYYLRRFGALSSGVDLFVNNRIYFDWLNSPLTSLLSGQRGPFLLRQLSIGNDALFLLGCAVLGVAIALIYIMFWPREFMAAEPRQQQKPHSKGHGPKNA
ncbi:MAG: hypothetical protein NTX06_09000, partial [Proteobacteria bacterium]|nr:hypothetical protein [Pseudomonadota bacterium]